MFINRHTEETSWDIMVYDLETHPELPLDSANLEPFVAKYPDMGYGYLIELMYIKRGQWSEAKQTAAIKEARGQLVQYRKDARLKPKSA